MKVRSPPVTVLIPAFNAMPYLRDAVESTLVQSYYEIELLVVNDGSTDATQEFLEGVGDPRIRVITQSNQGLVASLNRGLEAASHEFIARLDADEIMDKRRIMRQLEFLVDNPDFSLVATGYGFIRENSTPMPIRVRPRVANAPYFDPLVDPNILHTGVMYRRSVVLSLGGYRDLVPAEDLDLWLRMAEHTSLAAIPDVLTYVRVRSDGITWQGFEKQRMMWMYIKDCAALRII